MPKYTQEQLDIIQKEYAKLDKCFDDLYSEDMKKAANRAIKKNSKCPKCKSRVLSGNRRTGDFRCECKYEWKMRKINYDQTNTLRKLFSPFQEFSNSGNALLKMENFPKENLIRTYHAETLKEFLKYKKDALPERMKKLCDLPNEAYKEWGCMVFAGPGPNVARRILSRAFKSFKEYF